MHLSIKQMLLQQIDKLHRQELDVQKLKVIQKVSSDYSS